MLPITRPEIKNVVFQWRVQVKIDRTRHATILLTFLKPRDLRKVEIVACARALHNATSSKLAKSGRFEKRVLRIKMSAIVITILYGVIIHKASRINDANGRN